MDLGSVGRYAISINCFSCCEDSMKMIRSVIGDEKIFYCEQVPSFILLSALTTSSTSISASSLFSIVSFEDIYK